MFDIMLTSEIEQADLSPIDFIEVQREAVRLADSHAYDVRLLCPDGRRRTVKRIIHQFHLEKYLCNHDESE